VPHIKAEQLKALAVIGPNRLPALPEIKTLAEHGIKGIEAASGWHGLFAPAGTPANVIAKLNATLLPVLAAPAMRERIIALGAEPASSTPDELAKRLSEDLVLLGPIVKRTGASLD
jgi:tripartite-type tricarboxylate transporter receptor subunit TctC